MKTATNGASKRAALGATGHRQAVGGIELAWDDGGDGPALVCLHAIGHGASDFIGLRKRLQGEYRVIALDWPGQGNSGDDDSPPSAARYAQILGGSLDHLGVDRAVLLGNSIGGAASLIYAAAHPERVHALVLENPGGLAPVDDAVARFALGAMVRFFRAGARGARWFPAAFAAYYRLCVLPGSAASEQRRRICAAAFELAPVLAGAWQRFAAPEADIRGLAESINCPVLFAWAKRDQFVALPRSRAAIARFPNARLLPFAATHAAHLEAPDTFVSALESFLDEVGWRRQRQPRALAM